MREPSNDMDRFHLIAEVRKRPALWNVENRFSQREFYLSWDEVANCVGADVQNCRKVWRYLRHMYGIEIKRSKERIDVDKKSGEYDPNKDYSSKWAYFKYLSFLNERSSMTKSNSNNTYQVSTLLDMENSDEDFEPSKDDVAEMSSDGEESSKSTKRKTRSQKEKVPKRVTRSQDVGGTKRNIRNEDIEDSSINKSETQYPQFLNVDNTCIKVEGEVEIEADLNLTNDGGQIKDTTKRPRLENKNSKEKTNSCNNKSFENHKIQENNDAKPTENISIPEEKNTNTHSMPILPDMNDSDQYFLMSFSAHLKSMSPLQNLQFRAKTSALILSILTTSASDNTIKQKEYKLQMNTMIGITDLDCNFLVSFGPYMKSMSKLQNLKFRCQISNLISNILSTPQPTDQPVPTTSHGISNNK